MYAADRGAIGPDPREVFVMVGAEPNNECLGGCLRPDAQGFVLTGNNGDGQAPGSAYATTFPGVFAIGDVRSGSTKWVVSGVGEGPVVIHAVHRYLNPGLD